MPIKDHPSMENINSNSNPPLNQVSASQNVNLISTGKSYSITQLCDASIRVNQFIEINRRLPGSVTIAGQSVPMSDFLYLLSRAVVNLDGGVTSSVVHYRVGSPVYSRDVISTGNVLRGEYVGLARDVNSVVLSTGVSSSSISSSRGNIGFESQVYLFSRIVAFYGSQNRLPNFAGVSPWTGPKLPDPPVIEPPEEKPQPDQLVSTGNTYSITQIVDASRRVRDFVSTNNRLPDQVTIAGQSVPMSDFLYLLSRVVVNLDGGVTSSVVHYRVGSPVYSRDKISTGNVLQGEYVGLARDVNSVVESTGRAPSSISSSRGSVGFESQVYLFSRIVAFYGTQNRLPNHASLSPWNGPKLPDPPAGEIPQEPNGDVKIINTATGGNVTLNPYVNKYLPQTQLSQEIVSKANQGTPMVSFGTGEPQVMIVAGLHGNEIPATIAAMRLINYLDGRKLKGTVHIIPFAIPYTTSINNRLWQGQDPNRIANIPGTPSNIILNKAKELDVAGMGDFHSTQPGGVPGKTSIICTQVPTYQSYNLASYISQQTGSQLINHNTAGVVYPGGLEDEGSKAGIPSIIGEVMSPHGYADSNTINISYQQMLALLKYYNIL
ncbi:pseudomurein-binding repeat-containing protein [Methanobacterium alkalithermotolerans]|nr:pseudomurein-binding repeat-containing protein [Methanobacterium alkalithermotolerans]